MALAAPGAFVCVFLGSSLKDIRAGRGFIFPSGQREELQKTEPHARRRSSRPFLPSGLSEDIQQVFLQNSNMTHDRKEILTKFPSACSCPPVSYSPVWRNTSNLPRVKPRTSTLPSFSPKHFHSVLVSRHQPVHQCFQTIICGNSPEMRKEKKKTSSARPTFQKVSPISPL